MTQVGKPLHPARDFLSAALNLGQVSVCRLLAEAHSALLEVALNVFKLAYDAAKKLDLAAEAVILVTMAHITQDFFQVLVLLALFALELQVETQFPETDRAQSERLLVSFRKLR